MFCIIAFVVLSILGIFSATNRALAREALDCVLRRVTFRPCTTGFDEKIKAKILGSVIMRSEGAARFLNRNFEILSWVFFILLTASSIMAVRGVYLFYVTGSCNGLNDSGFCVFDPSGENNQISTQGPGCVASPNPVKGLTLQNVDTSDWPTLTGKNSGQIVFVGCYACDYSRKAYPIIRELASRYDVSLVFGEVQVKEKSDYLTRVGYCLAKQDPAKIWPFNDAMFAADKEKLDQPAFVDGVLSGLGVDAAKIETCAADAQTADAVKKHLTDIQMTNFQGTPTIFINGVSFVGPKPCRVYAIELKGLLYWLY
jgi:hypothetical protein